MFFGKKKQYFLGIDFGTSLIKAVELVLEDGKPKLSNFGQVNLTKLEKGELSEGNTYDDEVVLYLRALLASFHPKSTSAYVAMPAFIGLISMVELPEMNEDELKEAVKFEAHKYVPSPLEDVALSWEVAGVHEDGQGQKRMEILLVAALKKEVERYQKYISGVNLRMEFLELETFSLARSIIGQEEGAYLLIDIGSRATNLVLVENGIVKMSRNLDVGGKDVTRTLHEGLEVTLERAETLKKSTQDFLMTPESKIMFPSLDMVSSEAMRMLQSFQEKYPEVTCRGVVLSGGTAQMTGLVPYYTQVFGLPVSIGDPWKRISYDTSVAPEVKKLGTSFSVALGLALSGIDAIDETKKTATQKPFSLKELLTKDL
ncbi:MAG: type IV pilus assembly protein PilM [Candidatus Moranbacteria bacterium]|nr:type IV pilus assembly protein PilM [Candidatus Moranbacteria bacterium]